MAELAAKPVRRLLGIEALRNKFDEGDGRPGRSTIYRWEEAGFLPPSIKVGARRFWYDDEVDDHIARERAESEAA